MPMKGDAAMQNQMDGVLGTKGEGWYVHPVCRIIQDSTPHWMPP